MNLTFVQIFWIVLIIISIMSLRRIIIEKGWKIQNFIRVEDVDQKD